MSFRGINAMLTIAILAIGVLQIVNAVLAVDDNSGLYSGPVCLTLLVTQFLVLFAQRGVMRLSRGF